MNKINFYLESRLALIKKRAEGYAKNNPFGAAYQSALEWQVKYGRKGWRSYDSSNDYDNEGNMRLYNLDDFDCVPIQELGRRAFDYSGYYADNFQSELIRPYIVRIKTSRGLFIAPAIGYTDSDIATIYLSKGEFCSKDQESINYDTCAFQMARIADSIAEREAERSRDEDAKWQAQQQTEDLKEENKKARQEAHALILAIKEQRKIGDIVAPICNALIADIRSLRRLVNLNNQKINILRDDYWQAVD